MIHRDKMLDVKVTTKVDEDGLGDDVTGVGKDREAVRWRHKKSDAGPQALHTSYNRTTRPLLSMFE